MTNGTNEESYKSSSSFPNVCAGTEIYVSVKEVVDGDVPFTGELHPVGTVPPVGVEVSICETCGLEEDC